ncbi:MAG: hypothetical protein Q8T11_07620 [Elusimicrobiota bacterium]|nr:hypothetical protein [Elusimicrobiota bacterium]
MSFNKRMRRILEVCTAILLLLVLATALALKPGGTAGSTAGATVENPVTLNIRTMLYHCPACDLVRHCGTDCRIVDLSEAVRRGGKPCSTCGGVCAAR